MTLDPLSDLRRADAHARWRVADALALRPEAAGLLATGPVFLAGWMDDEDEDDEGPGYEVTADGVAIVPVEGALMDRASWCWDGYDAIVRRVEAAHADARVRALVLDLDSPGGMVAGLFDAMRALRAARAKSGKRCVAHTGSGAYSAAYGLASTCDEIVCSDTAGVGSVGVIASLTSRVDQLAQDGVSVRVVASGTEKTDGHPAVPISDAALARLTARVGELAGMFFAEVALGRPALTPDALAALDGGVRHGAAAVAAGLADRVMSRAALLASLTPMAPQAPASRLPTGATRATRTTMDENLLAALTAATGESDPAQQALALTSLRARADAAEASLARMTEDHAAALYRAQVAEQRAEGLERATELEAAKASGQWTPALEGFLATLSVPQLRAWRETAPRAVPEGEIKAPAAPPHSDAQAVPAALATAIEKARSEGWNALTGGEKSAITRHNRELAESLRRSR